VFYARSVHDSGAEILVSSGSGWTNPIVPEDVDANGEVQPLDALFVINFIRRGRYFTGLNRTLVPGGSVAPNPRQYVDNDSDGNVSPIDALRVINFIRRRRSSGESPINESPINESPVNEFPVNEFPVNEFPANASSIDLGQLKISQLSGDTTIISRSTAIDKPTDPQRPVAQVESANDQCFKQISTDTFDFRVDRDDISNNDINTNDTEETASSDLREIDDFFADF
jgi:hypothetical protein